MQVNDLKTWLQNSEIAGSDVAWLPLDQEVRDKYKFDVNKLMGWVKSVEGSDYSFVKEFFAAIDNSSLGWAAPFDTEALPILLRLYLKSPLTTQKDELLEALRLRYQESMTEGGQDKFGNFTTYADLVVLLAKDLNTNI